MKQNSFTALIDMFLETKYRIMLRHFTWMIILVLVSSCKNNYEINKSEAKYSSNFKWKDSIKLIDDPQNFGFDEKNNYRKEKTPNLLIKTVDDFLKGGIIENLSEDDKLIANDYLNHNIIGEVYKWRIENEKIDFVFFCFDNPILGNGVYVFISKNGIYSKFPFLCKNLFDESQFDVLNRWLNKPLFEYIDVNHDSVKELVLKERVHNGNVYDAVITHYLNFDKNLKIKPFVHIESIARINGSNENFILRKPEFYQKEKIKLLSLIVSQSNNTILDTIGESYIDLKEKLMIKSTKIKNKKFEDLLITSSSLNNDLFLLQGYRE